MSLSDIREIYGEARKLGSIEWIYFEGGEPFLYYPIMVKALREAAALHFKTGIVTNAYWATTEDDAMEWLKPIAEGGIQDLSVSDDAFHYDAQDNNAKRAVTVAKTLRIPVNIITIEDPKQHAATIQWKGRPVMGDVVMFKGRAVEKLVAGLPRQLWTTFDRCLDEDFAHQRRVHLDPFGFVHVCQGIAIGNFHKTPLSDLLQNFEPTTHPICGSILRGGPAELVRAYDVPHEDGYVDECHLCYVARCYLRRRFPKYLAPGQMYGDFSAA